MKKIIALLLSLIMIFSFTGCARLSAQGQKVSAMLTTLTNKTVRLTVKGDLLEGTVKEIAVPTDEGGGTFVKGEILKDNGKTITAKFTGLEEGVGLVDLKCYKNEAIVCDVLFLLSVNSDLKLSFSGLDVLDGEFIDVQTSGDNQEEVNENIQVPYMGDEESSLLFLKTLDGEWIADEYDDQVVDPRIIAIDGDVVKYQALPLSQGETSIKFINLYAMKKVVATYTIKENGVDSFGDKNYTVKLKDIVFSDYTMDEYLARKDQGRTVRKVQLVDSSFRAPADWIVNGASLYNAKTMEEFVVDEDAVIEDIKLPENIDTASVDMAYGDSTVELVISKAKNFEALCKEIDSLKATKSKEDLQIGTRSVRYYNTTYGFNVAIWQEEQLAYKITFTNSSSAEADKQVLQSYLGM